VKYKKRLHYIKGPKNFPDSHFFYDNSHLRFVGSMKYTQKLVEQIIQLQE